MPSWRVGAIIVVDFGTQTTVSAVWQAILTSTTAMTATFTLTGQYGIFSRLERFKELKLERLMEVTLEEIRSGDFSKEWSREYEDGYPRLRNLIRTQERIDLWELEQQTIDMLKGY